MSDSVGVHAGKRPAAKPKKRRPHTLVTLDVQHACGSDYGVNTIDFTKQDEHGGVLVETHCYRCGKVIS